MTRIALRDFRHYLLSTSLSSLTNAALIFAFLLLISLSNALSNFAADSGPPNNLYILESEIISPEESHLPVGLVDDVSEILANDAIRVDPVIFRIMRVEGQTIQLRGVSSEAWRRSFQLTLSDGKWPSDDNEIIIGKLAADQAAWEPGSLVEIYGSTFRVSGIADGPGTKAHAVWMDYDAASKLFGQFDRMELLVVHLDPSADPIATRQVLQGQLAARGSYQSYFEDALVREYSAAFRDIRSLSVLLTGIAVVAVAFGSHNQAWLAAEQRRASLGILRVLGFTRRSVERYLNLRGLAINTIGYCLAYILAVLFIRLVLNGEIHGIVGYQITISLDPLVVLSGLLLSSVATSLGTWLSSRNMLARSPALLIGRGRGTAFS